MSGIEDEIKNEVAGNKVLIYGKGNQNGSAMRVHRRNHSIFFPNTVTPLK